MRLAFWRRKSIEEHLAPITNIVDGLKDHADHHAIKSADHEDLAARHAVKAGAAQIESDRALAQMNLIAGLLPR